MKTSYFAKSANNPNAVAIVAFPPKWFKGRVYSKLAPKPWFLKKYKEDSDQEFYIKHFYIEVLDRLDPKKTYEELGKEAILLCYEAPGKFCHRHLVAAWLKEKLGIEVEELDEEPDLI